MVILNVELPRKQVQSMYSTPLITPETNNNNIAHFNDEGIIRQETPIQSFYAGQSIFITGGTGFLGKVLVEKLLRTCPNLSKVYMLIRPKKEKNIESRIEDLFSDAIFQRLKEAVPKFRHKIHVVPGDCNSQDLGLSSADRDLLVRNVSIVFHVAATVRFDEKLKLATATNVRSTADVIDLCKNMQNLKSFMHVSTTYANCHEKTITEEFYDYPIKHEAVLKLMECLPEDIIEEITPRIIKPWPNTYTFTKAMAEDLVKEKNKGLPMGIFRPAIVISTAKEPIAGWIDNLYGPTGVAAGAATGVLRTLHADKKLVANVVPVDLTVNALIASAWDVATQFNKRDEEMLIYNFVSSLDAPLTWRDFQRMNLMYAKEYPMSNSIWHVTFDTNKHKTLYTISIILFHLVPALLVDTIHRCLGQKPRLLKMYGKIHKFSEVLSHFSTQHWDFTNNNIHDMWSRLDSKDRQIYAFLMKDFDWNEYFSSYIKGIRLYLFKDDMNTLEQSKTRQKRFYMLHHALKMLTITVGFWFLWNMFSKFILYP